MIRLASYDDLNQILDKEIEFCENFEGLLLQKKELLIRYAS